MALLLLIACLESVATPDDLRVDFRIHPAVVHPADSMVARLTIMNPTGDTVTLSSGSSCVATLAVLRDSERVDMQGTSSGCLAVISYFPIAPNDSLIRTFDLVALLREDQSPWHYSQPPPAGLYQLRAAMKVHLPDEHAKFEVVQ